MFQVKWGLCEGSIGDMMWKLSVFPKRGPLFGQVTSIIQAVAVLLPSRFHESTVVGVGVLSELLATIRVEPVPGALRFEFSEAVKF